MEYYHVDVRISGSNDHIVCKQNVSVAEMEIYRLIHGSDACTNIQYAGSKQGTNLAVLRQSLEKKFPRYAEKIKKELFPGAHPRMPLKIQDIGFVKEGDKFRVFEPERDGAKGVKDTGGFDEPSTGATAVKLNEVLAPAVKKDPKASQFKPAAASGVFPPVMLPPVLAGAAEEDDGFNVDFEGAEKPQPAAAKG